MAAVIAETISSRSETLGPMTGRRYVESLRDGREVWIDGERVDDVTTHPAFKDMIAELERIYDLQNSEKYRDEMTCIDPATGRRISVSWLIAALGRRSQAQEPQQRAVERAQLGPARPQSRHPGAVHYLRASSQRPIQRSQASEMRFRRKYGELLQILHEP
jgi:aromatic ring hydroxylase